MLSTISCFSYLSISVFCVPALLGIPQCRAQNAYIPCADSGTVAVIDTASVPPSVTATITLPSGSSPHEVAVSADGRKVYVTSNIAGEPQQIGAVQVIDTASNNVTNTITLPSSSSIGAAPVGIAVSPDGKKAYVVSFTSNILSVIDTANDTITGTIALPSGSVPYGVAVTPDSRKVYVASATYGFPSGIVSVIDAASVATISTIAIDYAPIGIAISPDGRKVYVGNAVIDTASNAIAATISLPAVTTLYGVTVTPDGRNVYVSNTESSNVLVIDTSRNVIAATIELPVGSRPLGIAVTPDGKHVYTANFGLSNVSVIDTWREKVSDTITAGIGSRPYALGQFIQACRRYPLDDADDGREHRSDDDRRGKECSGGLARKAR